MFSNRNKYYNFVQTWQIGNCSANFNIAILVGNCWVILLIILFFRILSRQDLFLHKMSRHIFFWKKLYVANPYLPTKRLYDRSLRLSFTGVMLGVFSTKQRHDITVFNTCNGNNLYLWDLFKEYLKLLNRLYDIIWFGVV